MCGIDLRVTCIGEPAGGKGTIQAETRAIINAANTVSGSGRGELMEREAVAAGGGGGERER